MGRQTAGSDLKDAQGDAFILRPTGKNLLVSPMDFEKAAEGQYLLVFRAAKIADKGSFLPYAADKKVLDFSAKSKSCRLLSISEYTPCERFASLVASGFYEHVSMGAKFLALLKKRDNFAKTFFDTWKQCASTHAKLVCDDLINDSLLGKKMLEKPHMSQLLRTDHRDDYKAVLAACKCNPTESSDKKLSYNCPTTLDKARVR